MSIMKTHSKPVTKTILPALRAAGIKIRIRHKRHFVSTFLLQDGSIPAPYPEALPYGRRWQGDESTSMDRVYPRGGETSVELLFPDGWTYTGIARCSLEDRFDRKLGISIALSRALAARKKYKHGYVPITSIVGADFNP